MPRVRDRVNEECLPLKSYKAMHTVVEPSEGLLRAIALGVGTRNFKGVIDTAVDAFGGQQVQHQRSVCRTQCAVCLPSR